jgi:hypothetical protein
VVLWYILWSYDIFMAISYIFHHFGTLHQINLAPRPTTRLNFGDRGTRLSKNRPKGDCLLGAVFRKLKIKPYFWLFFSHGIISLCINFAKKWVGLHFWRLLDRLNWPHCLAIRKRCQILCLFVFGLFAKNAAFVFSTSTATG